MSIRNNLAAFILGAAMAAPTAQFAFAESDDGYTSVYQQMAAAQQPRTTLWGLLTGHEQPQREVARNAAGIPTASDAGISGSSQPKPAGSSLREPTGPVLQNLGVQPTGAGNDGA